MTVLGSSTGLRSYRKPMPGTAIDVSIINRQSRKYKSTTFLQYSLLTLKGSEEAMQNRTLW